MNLEVKYEPDQCKKKDAKFKGHLLLTRPKLEDRYEYRSIIGLDYGADGSVEAKAKDKIQALLETIKWSAKFIKEVHIQRSSDGYAYESFEDLCYDPDAEPMIINVASALAAGFSPSKN